MIRRDEIFEPFWRLFPVSWHRWFWPRWFWPRWYAITRPRQAMANERNGVVNCDVNCDAKLEPETAEELRAAYEHWRRHSWLQGCSHAA